MADDPRASLTPEDSQPQPWATTAERAVAVAERVFARLDGLDRTVREDLRKDIEQLVSLARRSDIALDRIATAEEDRTRLAREEAKERREAARAAQKQRAALLDRVAASPITQLLVLAILGALLNLAGLRWIAERIIPPAPPVLLAPTKEGEQ